ncbi:unnamed protein product [marine sediment metagenome]|uniref:Uncharacterized protein n=1 Tax=marine sediment metagenome TaxID=412755 RepID=X1PVJ3_9ZZZZ
MIELILLTIVLAAVIAFALTHNRRANARAEADRIISGERSATEDQISEIIRTLVATKSWTRDGAGRDYYRLQQLQNIRDEVRKAKSRKYREWFRARADRIIAGEQPTRDEELDLVIDHFQLMRLMAQHKIYQDRQLLEQLLNIRNEIRKSHSLPPSAPFDPNLFEGYTEEQLRAMGIISKSSEKPLKKPDTEKDARNTQQTYMNSVKKE